MPAKYPEIIVQEWEREPDVERLWGATDLLKTDVLTAIKKLEDLSMEGSALSMMYLGDTYLYGRKVEIDLERGERWMRQSVARGSIEGMYRLARYYQSQGRNDEAKCILVQLCDHGFSPAMYILGLMYYEGSGVEKDINMAEKYWTMAELNGHIIAKQAISIMLRSGRHGIFGKIKGYVKLIQLLTYGVAYRILYPESDRLRYW